MKTRTILLATALLATSGCSHFLSMTPPPGPTCQVKHVPPILDAVGVPVAAVLGYGGALGSGEEWVVYAGLSLAVFSGHSAYNGFRWNSQCGQVRERLNKQTRTISEAHWNESGEPTTPIKEK